MSAWDYVWIGMRDCADLRIRRLAARHQRGLVVSVPPLAPWSGDMETVRTCLVPGANGISRVRQSYRDATRRPHHLPEA